MLKSCCKNLTNILLSDIIDITFLYFTMIYSVYLKTTSSETFSAVTLPMLLNTIRLKMNRMKHKINVLS